MPAIGIAALLVSVLTLYEEPPGGCGAPHFDDPPFIVNTPKAKAPPSSSPSPRELTESLRKLEEQAAGFDAAVPKTAKQLEVNEDDEWVAQQEAAERQLYEQESVEILSQPDEDWEAIEAEHLKELFWRNVMQQAAATIAMAFVMYLMWGRYMQLAAAKAKGASAPSTGASSAPAATPGTTPAADKAARSDHQKEEKKCRGEKKGKGEKKAQQAPMTAEEKEAKKAAEAAEKLKKKVIKEGGKKGVEIEGASDMGGLDFFCTTIETPDGDLELLQLAMDAMNAQPEEGDEERKGCSGHVGKMIFSAGAKQLAIVAYVPADKEERVDVAAWATSVVSAVDGELASSVEPALKAETHPHGGMCIRARVAADPDAGKFPLKDKDAAMAAAFSYLRSKGAFPEDDGESDDDEIAFGDDAFDEMNGW